MTMTPDRADMPGDQPPIPIFRIDPAKVDDAFIVFVELRHLAQSKPWLTDNEFFTAVQDTAYARFLMNFEAM